MKVRDLVIRRGTTTIGPLSADFPPGTVTVVTGPSGSGKTSLCLALIGLVEPVSGTVEAPSAVLVPQNPREWLNPGQTVRRAVEHAALAAGRGRGGRSTKPPGGSGTAHGQWLEEIARQCRVAPDVLERRIGLLSGGQAARVAIARALATDPAALVCDEPTASLDVSNAAQIAHTLTELAAAGRSVVWATHDLSLARAVAPDAPRVDLG